MTLKSLDAQYLRNSFVDRQAGGSAKGKERKVEKSLAK
jgi:hypothetical protein